MKEKRSKENILSFVNYALSYNNSIHSTTEYTPFQIIRGKLSHKDLFELTENDKINSYFQDYVGNIKVMQKEIYDNISSKPQKRLDNENKNRMYKIKFDPNVDIY